MVGASGGEDFDISRRDRNDPVEADQRELTSCPPSPLLSVKEDILVESRRIKGILVEDSGRGT